MDRRCEHRIPVELPGSLKVRGSAEQKIWYSQISSNGCRVSGVADGLLVGDIIDVCLGPVGVSRATVRWVQPGAIGAQFHAELHPAVVSYFSAFLVAAA